MIRNWLTITIALMIASGCASWKKPKESRNLKPGTFTVSSVSVKAKVSPASDLEFAELMRRAADRNRIAYNAAVGGNERSYRMVLSLDDLSVDGEALSFLPVTQNKIKVTATLYDDRSGNIATKVPVSHQLIAIDPEETRDRQLIRGVIPKTFNKMHGLASTPDAVEPVAKSRDLFEPESYIYSGSQRNPSSVSGQTQDVNAGQQNSVEPKVISCAVC